MEQYQNMPDVPAKKPMPLWKVLGIAVVIWLLLILVLTVWFFLSWRKTETTFTPERLSEISSRAALSFDGVTLEKYRTATAAGDVFDELWISGISSPETFMQDNVLCGYSLRGENVAAGSNRNSYSGNAEDICTVQYEYTPENQKPYQQTKYIITFFAAEGGYNAKVYVSKW